MVLFSVAVTGVFKIYFSYVILIPRVLFLIRFSSFVHSRGFPQMSGDLWMSACVQKGDTHLWPLAVCESGGLPAVAPLPRGPTQANPLVRTVGSSSSGSLDSPEQLSASCRETPPPCDQETSGELRGAGSSWGSSVPPSLPALGSASAPPAVPGTHFPFYEGRVSFPAQWQPRPGGSVGQGGPWRRNRL